MQTKVINPYTALGADHKESLDYLIANLPPSPTFDDLNSKLAEWFFQPDPNDPSPLDVAADIIRTILPHAYNGYVNGGVILRERSDRRISPDKSFGDSSLRKASAQNDGNGYWRYSENQIRLIERMLNGINTIPVEAIGEFLGGIEEEIVSGRDAMHRVLTYEEQIPLLAAVQIGKSDYEYWQAQIATPGAWAAYLNTDNTINYLHVAGWVNAAMQGALLTYGLIRPPQVQFIDVWTSLISATGLVAGKVIFGWIGK